MAYREQKAAALCKICRELSASVCPRCGDPLCDQHMPSEDQRCLACENLWLEKASGWALNSWGLGSRIAVKTAKWSAIAGGLGVCLAFIGALIGEFLLWPSALLLLGFPLSIAALVSVPFFRAAERGVDSLQAHHRRKFLAEKTDRDSKGP